MSTNFRCLPLALLLVLKIVSFGTCCLSQGCGQPNGVCPAYAQSAAPFSQYQSDYAVNNFLGPRVTAKAFSSGGKGAFISKALDLLCYDLRSCQWQNDDNDELDWNHGEGNVDAEKIRLITGSYTMPGNWDDVISSYYRLFLGQPMIPVWLVSDPISCQKEMGVLSFQMWRSRARLSSQEPDLDICIRTMESTALQYCQTVAPDHNNLIRASIPPTEHSFYIVIRGYGFENYPEGGLILVADIRYAASVENIANCEGDVEAIVPLSSESDFSNVIEDYEELHSATISNAIRADDTVMLIDQDSELDIQSSEPVRRLQEQKYEAGEAVENTNHHNHALTRESCLLLKCTKSELSTSTFCGYLLTGSGAAGIGRNGWQVVNVTANTANRLTGVHNVPSSGNQNVFVATFPSRHANLHHSINRFVLESPYLEFSSNDALYLGFQRYIAVHGIELAMCADGEAQECFYHYPPRRQPFAALMSRSWQMEKVQLPTHLNKVFIIAQSVKGEKQNAGQIGIADIKLYDDAETTKIVC